MDNNFIDSHLDRLLPNDLKVINAEEDRLYASNGEIFYNFFNDSLRWLCGYDNAYINRQINIDINAIENNPRQINNLANQVESVLCQNAGKNYKHVYFCPVNSYSVFYNRMVTSEKKFFIILSHNVFIPSNLEESFVEFESLLEAEPDIKRSKFTEEGWSVKKIKTLFSHYKNRIAGFIISPLLLSKGEFLSKETCEFLAQICKKYNVPLIWDESLTAFFRTGTFYFLNQYSIDPDFITINANISQNGSTHIIIANKKANRKFMRGYKGLNPKQNAPSLIILHCNLLFITKKDITRYGEQISYRFTRKLNALSANTHGRFGIQARGLVIYLDFKQINILDRIHLYLLDNNILVYSNKKDSLLLLPQLTLSSRAVDLFIQNVDDFFKSGLKLPNK